ncbi:MAG: tRNA (adenosine(37)-N6)-threonylcarbamoyltransferase complex dimerization subunit type 1 TsaB [bacterium]|nr:tRNA (adenosine(37)-N6)-threonylcarbamoyltransferase complex dimerization subunit type 1 TsaB [bacterium]
MILYINTSNNTNTIVGLDDKRLEKATGPDKSQQVLLLIDQILKDNKRILSDLTEIEVAIGPGSFTGLRVGVAVANALAWALNISVNGEKMVEPKYE